jgi:thiosulfate/3-mercaptopyruvate sulfurtransferase
MTDYAHPEVLVTTDWVASHLNDPNIRLIEVDVDTSAYDQGHVPGAVGWNWQTQLQDTLRRDLADQLTFGQLAGSAGLTPQTTVILYGDNNNWFAAWGFWQLKYYGHNDVRLMNGGRKKWLEEKRPLSTDAPKGQPTTYSAKSPDTSIRAKREDIFSVLERRSPAGTFLARRAFRGRKRWPKTELSSLPTRSASFTAARASPANRKSSRIAVSGSVARTRGSF